MHMELSHGPPRIGRPDYEVFADLLRMQGIELLLSVAPYA